MDPAIILFGLGVGLLVGITGMGGGSLMTPLLILVIGTKPVVAVGTDLAYGAVTKTLGGWRHFRKGTVFPRLALWLAVGSCPGALLGVCLLGDADRHRPDPRVPPEPASRRRHRRRARRRAAVGGSGRAPGLGEHRL